MNELKIRDFMTPEPLTLREIDTVRKAAELFYRHKFDGVPVVNVRGEIAGIFTKTHLYRILVEGLSPETTVKQLMKRDVLTIHEDDPPSLGWRMALDYGIGRLPVINHEGKLVGMMARTDLVKAFEEGYLNTIHHLKAILDSAHGGIYAVNKQGEIITFNQVAAEIMGVPGEEVLGKPLETVLADEELLEVLETGKAQFNRPMVLNGVKVIANRTPIINNGSILGAVTLFQDITELEAVSQELTVVRELWQQLDALFTSSYDGIALCDSRGNTLKINEAFRRLTGEETKVDWDTGAQENFIVRQVVDDVFAKGSRVNLVQPLETGNTLLVTGTPIFDEAGKINLVVVNCRDISELNRLRHQLEATQQLKDKYFLELEALRAQQMEVGEIIANSGDMQRILELVLRIAKVDTTVLILGESGVGKQVVAKTIHKTSLRSRGPFIQVNCGAIPESLLESELFGYEGGAFTGAKREGKPGLFELAEGGTLFLDEVGELPLNLQVKLLNAIQDREIIRVGGTKPVPVDFRLVAATNRDLAKMVQEGTFRVDLYYRLNVVPIHIPPLRLRQEDILPLTRFFLERFNKKYGLQKRITPELLHRFYRYDWPGNVRELENIVERLVVVSEGDLIGEEHFTGFFQEEPVTKQELDPALSTGEEEARELARLYSRYGSTRKVARVLGVHQSTVVRRMKKYNIKPHR